jgi:outer membrane protein
MRRLPLSRASCRVLGVGAALVAVAAPLAAQATDSVTLGQAITEALDHSPTVRQARAAVSAAKGQVREAWATVLPDINASASYQRNFMVQEAFLPRAIFDPTAGPDDLLKVRFGAENNWSAGFTVNQPLFQVDAFIGVGAAGRYRALQEEVARGTTQGVVTDVRQRYLGVLAAAELVRLNEESVRRVRETLEDTRARYRAGLTSEYDVLRFEVQLANLEPGLRRARDGVATAKRALLIAMGRDASSDIEVVGRLQDIDVLAPEHNTPEHRALIALSGPLLDSLALDSAAATAIAQRSDVRQAELGIVVEQARLKVERAQLFPKLSLFGAYSLTAQDPGSPDFFGGGSQYRSGAAWAGLRVELPVFRGFREYARMQQARANIDENRARLALAREQTVDQLRTLIAALGETRERVASERDAVGQARRGYQIATAQYQEGLGSQLQVTDAELALRQSEYNYAQAVFDHLIARSNLDAALGTVPDAADLVSAARR